MKTCDTQQQIVSLADLYSTQDGLFLHQINVGVRWENKTFTIAMYDSFVLEMTYFSIAWLGFLHVKILIYIFILMKAV